MSRHVHLYVVFVYIQLFCIMSDIRGHRPAQPYEIWFCLSVLFVRLQMTNTGTTKLDFSWQVLYGGETIIPDHRGKKVIIMMLWNII